MSIPSPGDRTGKRAITTRSGMRRSSIISRKPGCDDRLRFPAVATAEFKIEHTRGPDPDVLKLRVSKHPHAIVDPCPRRGVHVTHGGGR